MNHRTWSWWLYLVLVVAVGYGRMIERIVREVGGFWSQFGPAISATVVAVGVTFWLRKRPVASVWLWRVLHFLLALSQVTAIAFAVYLLTISVYYPAGILVVATVLLVPALFALHDYAYHCPRLWEGT